MKQGQRWWIETVVGLTALIVLLSGSSPATATDSQARRASVVRCQAAVRMEGKKLLDGYALALGACLQKVSGELGRGLPVTRAIGPCTRQLQRLYRVSGSAPDLATRFTDKVTTACSNARHGLADVLGPGAVVPQPIGAASLGGYCRGFGGDGSIGSLSEWVSCVRQAHLCEARQALAAQYPRGREWLEAVQAGVASRSSDAATALSGALTAMYGPSGAPQIECGDGARLLTECEAETAQCASSAITCASDLATCQAGLATCAAGTAGAGDVLAGRTFAAGGSSGRVGTMPNRGGITLTPGTATLPIPAGYHDGTGRVLGDPDLVATNVRQGVNLFGVNGSAPAGLLVTGQTTSYGSGSDGDLQRGVSRSYVDNGNGTITDLRTGLMWEKKSNDGSVHDLDNTYTWGQTSPPYEMNGTIVTVFLSSLNTPPCFAGHCDWRIPNQTELHSLLDFGTTEPAIVSPFRGNCSAGCSAASCRCTAPQAYWSSSTARTGPGFAWQVIFGTGGAGHLPKSNLVRVRAIRGGQ